MNFAQENQASSRTTAFIIVILVHVAMIYALASGLATKIVKAVTEPIETKVIEAPKPPPPPPEKIVPPPPEMKAPPPPFVPVPEIQVNTPPPPNAIQAPVSSDPPPTTVVAATPPPAPPGPPAVAKPAGPVQAGVVCTKRPKPEISVQLESEAEFDVLLTIKNGKVVAKEITVRRGLSDRRAQRSLLSSVQAAVEAYECGNFDGQVTQPFLFKPE